MFRLLPKEFNFFDLFDKQALAAIEAGKCFKEIVAKGSVDEVRYQEIRDIEHKGDDLSHQVIDQLNKTFITPFDREDIHALTKELDDITDMIYALVNRMRVYRAGRTDKHLTEFAAVIEQSVAAVAKAVGGLRNRKNLKAVQEHCVEINRLENVGDSMRDTMLVELFEKTKDPIEVIKWKEIYQDAETVLDICEDVAHVVESILVKQA